MANTFSADFREIWAREQQEILYKQNVARAIANTTYEADLKNGDTLNKPYRSSNNIQKYVRGTAITIDDKTDTQDQLVINQQYATGFYMDNMDDLQSNYNLISEYARDDSEYLSNQIDADVLGEALNATTTVDDGTIGGTSGNGISLSTSNVQQVVGAVKKSLMKLNVTSGNLYGVVSPEFEDILIRYNAGRDTSMGDDFNKNGLVMSYYGFKIFRSNQLAGSAVLAMATDPTATNTVLINGVTFTAQSTIGAVAGNFLVGTDADTSRAVLTAFINDPGTTSASQVALSAANQRKFYNVSATNDATANTMTVVHNGAGVISVSETLAAAADVWTPALQKQHNMFGKVGAVTLVVQKNASPDIRKVQDKLGVNVLNSILYGETLYEIDKDKVVNVELQSSGF